LTGPDDDPRCPTCLLGVSSHIPGVNSAGGHDLSHAANRSRTPLNGSPPGVRLTTGSVGDRPRNRLDSAVLRRVVVYFLRWLLGVALGATKRGHGMELTCSE